MFRMDRSPMVRRLALTGLACMLSQSAVFGTWSQSTSVNNNLTLMPYVAGAPEVLSDGAGGTFVAWATLWGGSNDNVYLQYMDSAGDVSAPEVLVGPGYDPVIATDGAGGLFIAWSDGTRRLKIQRFDSTLNPLTTPISVTTSGAFQQRLPAILSDGNGGAIVAWNQQRPNGSHINAMHFDSNLSRDVAWSPWTTGFVVDASSGAKGAPDLASDSSESVFVVWEGIGGGSNQADIYARYINVGTLGVVAGWPNRQLVTGAPNHQQRPIAVSDGDFGFLVAWFDSRNGLSQLYAQRFEADGTPLWTPGGVLIGSGLSGEPFFDIDHDGSQGAVLAWNSYYEMRYQHLDSAGAKLMGTAGLPLTTSSSNVNQQVHPSIVADGSGGAVVAWGTASKINSNVGDIVAQHIDGTGTLNWVGPNGPARVSTALRRQGFVEVVSDAGCPARFFWNDDRLSLGEGIYGQRILCNGNPMFVQPGGGIGLTVKSLAASASSIIRLPVKVTRVAHEGSLGSLSLTLSFDPKVLALGNIVPGALEGLVAEVDEEQGTLSLVGEIGGLERGETLFQLIFEPRTENGSSAVAINRAGGNGVSVWPTVGVVTIGEPRR